MFFIINGIRYFYGYRIISNLRYNLNKDHLMTIIAVLKQSKQTMVVPMIAHYIVYITSEFDVTTLMPRVKRVLEGVPVAYAYSVELAQKLHIHLMLCLDADGHDDIDELFIDRVIPAISNLKHVMNCGCEIIIRHNTNSYYHDLRDSAEFEDAIERYSYFAKTNQKKYVTQTFKRAFNTTQITDKKYFDLKDKDMIRTIPRNRTQEFEINDFTPLSKLQTDIMNNKIKGEHFTKYFNINDQLTHLSKAVYSFSYHHYCSGSEQAIYITVDELCRFKQYYDAEWEKDLESQLYKIIYQVVADIQSKFGEDNRLLIYTLMPNLPELADYLSLAMNEVREERSISPL